VKHTLHTYNDQDALATINLLCTRYWPDRHGGVEQCMWHTSRAWAQAGCHVKVITENRTASPGRQTIAPNLTVRRLKPMQPGRLWRWPHWLRLGWWYRAIRQHAPTGVIWATDPIMATAVILARRSHDLVFNPAGCAGAMNHVAQMHHHVTTMRCPRGLIQMDRFAYKHAHHVVVSSDNVRRQLARFYGPIRSTVHVVPFGVQPPVAIPDTANARSRWGLGSREYVIGFVGRLDPCKGLDFLFKAVAKMDCPYRLLIVGDGPDRQYLRGLAHRIGISHNIVWVGQMSDPSQAYAAMDVLVLPSVYEAFGNVLLEAMAGGVPVVGRAGDDQTVFTAMLQIINPGTTGLICDPHDPTDLAMKLSWLAQHPQARQKMGQMAKSTTHAQPWSAVAEQYIRIAMGLTPQSSQPPVHTLSKAA